MNPRPARTALLPALLVTAAGLATFLFSLVTPIGEGPDEPAHLEYVREMPAALDDRYAGEILQGRPDGYEVHQPPLYYAIAAAWSYLVGADLEYPLVANPGFPHTRKGGAFLPSPPDARERAARSGVRLVRWLGLLFVAATVAAAWQVARAENADRPDLALLAALPFVLAPQLAFLGGVISNDALTFALCAWALWEQRRIFGGEAGWGPCCRAGLLTGASFWAKLSGWVLVPTLLLAALTLARKRCWRSLALLLAPVAMLGSSWLASQPSRFALLRQLAGDHHLGLWRNPDLLGDYPLWWLQLWMSYWAKLTVFQLRLPLALYLLYLPPTLLVLAGLRLAWRERHRFSSSAAGFWASALLTNLGLYGAFVLFVDFQHQGRLLYPTLAAAVGLASLGIAEIDQRRALPAWLTGKAPLAAIAVYFALQLAAAGVIVADEGWPPPVKGSRQEEIMSDEMKAPSKLGTIGWFDLTVPDAGAIKDFYAQVVGWKATETPVSDYADFTMEAPKGPVAGICHARGANAELPPVWLIYLHVADLDDSLASVRQLGGELIAGPVDYGPSGRYAIIRDPAGAHCALYQASA